MQTPRAPWKGERPRRHRGLAVIGTLGVLAGTLAVSGAGMTSASATPAVSFWPLSTRNGGEVLSSDSY